MSPHIPLMLQYVVIAVAVTISAWVVLNKQCPGLARRLRVALALPLVREARPAWLRAFGRRIAPSPKAGADACGACNSCDKGVGSP
jgi:hypothetical protein